MFLLLTIDVYNVIHSYFYCHYYIQSITASVTSIAIPNWACNDIDYAIFDFSRFTRVESIEIGDDCFGSVQTFKIDGLNRLKSLKIGSNSFTETKNRYGCSNSKSFHILNCESLESIQIGRFSFSDFGGDFELKNLPQLQSIQIGTIESKSFNFSCSSFVIQGIDMILNIWVMYRSSKSTINLYRPQCIPRLINNNNREY